MKYGYLYYRKGLLENKKERPMNLGDPIQSLAVVEILKKIGISEKHIIPIDRYDLATYAGEKVVLIINGAENYEHFAYHTKFLPVSEKIIPVFIGIHLHRELAENELSSFRQYQPIGCRDEYTCSYLKRKGIDAFLTGCLTLTFPRRQTTARQNTVFLVDCPESVMAYIPDELRENAVSLSQIIRIKSASSNDRLTDEETDYYSKMAKEQLFRLRDEASLVVTSRLHVATPCAAMGIPVVLARDVFDERFMFVDRFIPLYTPEKYSQIDWHPTTHIQEDVKEQLVSLCKVLLELAISRETIKKIYDSPSQEVAFRTEEQIAVQNLKLDREQEFSYAIWGVCMPNSFLLYEAMKEQYHNARMICAIDTWARGEYKDSIPIISPEQIDNTLSKDTVVLVVAPAAHSDAIKKLEGKYNFVLIKGSKTIMHIY